MDKFYEFNENIKNVFKSINKDMDAHLVESIISLFNNGVLKHYVRTPRANIDWNNFKMTVEAANGVTFEGREVIIQLENKLNKVQKMFNECSGWWYAEACSLMDAGKDIRNIPLPQMIDSMISDLEDSKLFSEDETTARTPGFLKG